MEFKVRNIFITGGNRGLGFALTKQMLLEFNPEHLFSTYRDKNTSLALIDLAKDNPNLHPIQFDVTDYNQLPKIVEKVKKITNGYGINLLFNNSGIFQNCPSIRNVSRDQILNHFETNTIAPTMISQAFIPLLEEAAALNPKNNTRGLEGATIINMSSWLGSIGENIEFEGQLPYRVSKVGLNMVSKIFSTNLKDTGIITLALNPGWVKTDMGTDKAPLTIDESIKNMMLTLRNITKEHNGKYLNYNGEEIVW